MPIVLENSLLIVTFGISSMKTGRFHQILVSFLKQQTLWNGIHLNDLQLNYFDYIAGTSAIEITFK